MPETIIAVFKDVERQVQIDPTIESLRAALPGAFPCLKDHVSSLGLRYVDDEDDVIFVTSTDELQEALRVGAMEGILRLSMILPASCADSVHPSPLRPEMEAADIQPTGIQTPTAPQSPETTETTETPEVLTVLHEAGAAAISEVNKALGSASAEISKVFAELSAASKKRADTEAQLTQAKAALLTARAERDQEIAEVAQLQASVVASQGLRVQALRQQQEDATRIATLTAELERAGQWEAKFNAAEVQRIALEQQLQLLRTGLLSLTGTVSTSPASATVVSSEAVPASPVLSPATPAELPPPYPEDAACPVPPVAHHDVFPTDEGVEQVEQKEEEERTTLSPELAQAMVVVSQLGFELTAEELQRRHQAANGNMEVLLNGLLDA